MPGRSCFFRDKLDGTRRIMLDHVCLDHPGEIAFQAHECPVDSGGLEPEDGLQIGPIPDQQGRRYCLRRKWLPVPFFTKTALTPRDELSEVTQIVVDPYSGEVFHTLKSLCIVVKNLLSFHRQSWLRCSFHRSLSLHVLADTFQRRFRRSLADISPTNCVQT